MGVLATRESALSAAGGFAESLGGTLLSGEGNVPDSDQFSAFEKGDWTVFVAFGGGLISEFQQYISRKLMTTTVGIDVEEISGYQYLCVMEGEETKLVFTEVDGDIKIEGANLAELRAEMIEQGFEELPGDADEDIAYGFVENYCRYISEVDVYDAIWEADENALTYHFFGDVEFEGKLADMRPGAAVLAASVRDVVVDVISVETEEGV